MLPVRNGRLAQEDGCSKSIFRLKRFAPHPILPCRFAEKACFFRLIPAGRQALPPHVLPFSTAKRTGHINSNFTKTSKTKTKKRYRLRLSLGAGLPRVPDSSPVKARWGRDGGLGGKGNTSSAGGGVPLPPKRQRIVSTDPNAGSAASPHARAQGRS